MITSTHLKKWADLLVNYAVSIQEGQILRINAQPQSEPLLEAVYRSALSAGAQTIVTMTPECLAKSFYELASDQQLDWQNPLDQQTTELIDASINIVASTDLHALDSIDPARVQQAARAAGAHRPLFFDRAAAADTPEKFPNLRPLRWSVTQYPTEAYAKLAGMTLDQYCEYVVAACQLDQDDPIAFWQSLDAWQCELAKQLTAGKELHYQTPAGTDLHVNISDGLWLSSPGRKNFPDGEVYSGPTLSADNGGVDGVVVFDQRTVYKGHPVSNVRITMEQGRATDVSADEGEDFLLSMLNQDDGARRVGEVAFGTNRAIKKMCGHILFDEKMGGTFHMAFGSGFPETGNTNKSALHWDLVGTLNEGSRVTLDGKDFCIDGKFVTMPPEVTWLHPSS